MPRLTIDTDRDLELIARLESDPATAPFAPLWLSRLLESPEGLMPSDRLRLVTAVAKAGV